VLNCSTSHQNHQISLHTKSVCIAYVAQLIRIETTLISALGVPLIAHLYMHASDVVKPTE
jgi:hypothetical protein